MKKIKKMAKRRRESGLDITLQEYQAWRERNKNRDALMTALAYSAARSDWRAVAAIACDLSAMDAT